MMAVMVVAYNFNMPVWTINGRPPHKVSNLFTGEEYDYMSLLCQFPTENTIAIKTQNGAVMRLALKDSKTADMDFRIGCFLLALPPLVVSKCAFLMLFSGMLSSTA